MTIAELIALLAKYDPKKIVQFYDPTYEEHMEIAFLSPEKDSLVINIMPIA
jgi:hypothetical protein